MKFIRKLKRMARLWITISFPNRDDCYGNTHKRSFKRKIAVILWSEELLRHHEEVRAYQEKQARSYGISRNL